VPRHYKVEAEIASMTWKVNWEEVLTQGGESRGKRGSHVSLAASRNSLVVRISFFPLYSTLTLNIKIMLTPIAHFHVISYITRLLTFDSRLKYHFPISLKHTQNDDASHVEAFIINVYMYIYIYIHKKFDKSSSLLKLSRISTSNIL